MSDSDERLSVKLNPPVATRFKNKQPEGMTQSEFVDKLLSEATFEADLTREDVRDVVDAELDSFGDRLIERLREGR